ncbi:MAG: hypothetical protein AABY22_11310 [Nanoarchaeota archaeon]
MDELREIMNIKEGQWYEITYLDNWLRCFLNRSGRIVKDYRRIRCVDLANKKLVFHGDWEDLKLWRITKLQTVVKTKGGVKE